MSIIGKIVLSSRREISRNKREEVHSIEEVEEVERRKALDPRAHDITIGKHDGQLEQKIYCSQL